jgi:hypothetical protein
MRLHSSMVKTYTLASNCMLKKKATFDDAKALHDLYAGYVPAKLSDPAGMDMFKSGKSAFFIHGTWSIGAGAQGSVINSALRASLTCSPRRRKLQRRIVSFCRGTPTVQMRRPKPRLNSSNGSETTTGSGRKRVMFLPLVLHSTRRSSKPFRTIRNLPIQAVRSYRFRSFRERCFIRRQRSKTSFSWRYSETRRRRNPWRSFAKAWTALSLSWENNLSLQKGREGSCRRNRAGMIPLFPEFRPRWKGMSGDDR